MQTINRPKSDPDEAMLPEKDMAGSKRKRTSSFHATEKPERKLQRGLTSPIVPSRAGDRISLLSDEILLRILRLLPVKTVLLCQSISKRWRALSTDGEVWRSLFWQRFVRPDSRRKRSEYTSDDREGNWVNEQKRKYQGTYDALDHNERKTVPRVDWKARYRLRHNWSRGVADVREIELQEDMNTTAGRGDGRREAANPAHLMARILDGKAATVDQNFGLRVWNLRTDDGKSECTARMELSDDGRLVPTALALDRVSETDFRIAVGLKDGGFAIWRLHTDITNEKDLISPLYLKLGSGDTGAALVSIAYTHPHLLTVTEEQALSLYVFEDSFPPNISGESRQFSTPGNAPGATCSSIQAMSKGKAPRLITSLKSHTSWPPLSLSIRPTPQAVIASIAYSLPTYTAGWSVGIQELHISHDGGVSLSRLASAAEQGFHSLLSPSASVPPSPSLSPRRIATSDHESSLSTSRPTSLSYSHPYLLASHPDNTLSLYLVMSTQNALHISKVRTLWGHTSSVSGAHVGERGKAVSISAQGEDLRVWELERGLASKRIEEDEGVRVRPEASNSALDSARPPSSRDNWVDFDEETVIVLKESEDGAKALVVYDFT